MNNLGSKKLKTNMKYLLIVIILALIIGGGILTYQYWWLPKKEIQESEIKIPEKEFQSSISQKPIELTLIGSFRIKNRDVSPDGKNY